MGIFVINFFLENQKGIYKARLEKAQPAKRASTKSSKEKIETRTNREIIVHYTDETTKQQGKSKTRQKLN